MTCCDHIMKDSQGHPIFSDFQHFSNESLCFVSLCARKQGAWETWQTSGYGGCGSKLKELFEMNGLNSRGLEPLLFEGDIFYINSSVCWLARYI